MISAQWRGSDLFERLGEVCSALTEDHDVRVVFGACEPHLISFYARFQRTYGTRNINSPEAGFLLPLISFPQGLDALRPLGRDGQLPLCIQQVQSGTGTVLSPLFVGDAEYQRQVGAEIAALPSSVFDGLTEEQLARCLERSNVVTGRGGDRLLKQGGAARNAFVVLDGELAVSRDGAPVGSVGPGEIVGEMASLLQQPRGFDVDVVEDGTRLLSLSERTLTGLVDTDPGAGAKLAANISRQLCRRLAAV